MTDQAAQIAVDTNPEEGYDIEDSASEITSLRSSITNYVYENGRRYHGFREGAYWGSNDEKAMDAMDILHHVYTLLTRGKLFLAPISEDVKQVLDIGTGTGRWAVDFGDLYPQATVIGTDLSPIQPSWAPQNVSFEIDDCRDEWVYKHLFDFIHIRGLYGCLEDWDHLYSQAFQHLAPGGYIEQVETDIIHHSDDGSMRNTKIEEAGILSAKSAAHFGKQFDIVKGMKEKMIKAGFVDVTEHRFKLPVGPWPKDKHLKTVGRYQRLVWEESLEMWVMLLWTRFLGMSREEVEAQLAGVKKDLYNPKIHVYQDVRICYGRKPTAEESAKSTN